MFLLLLLEVVSLVFIDRLSVNCFLLSVRCHWCPSSSCIWPNYHHLYIQHVQTVLICLSWLPDWLQSNSSLIIDSLSRFNGQLPGGPGLAATRMSPFWILLELRVWRWCWQLEL